MRLLFCGDVVGRAGRKALVDRLPALRAELALDAVIVNGENAAGGFGLTPTICQDFFAAGADLITTGNHVFDQREILPHMDREPRLIRPLNMMPGTPGRGGAEVRLVDGRRLLVLQVIGRLFMGPYDDPFRALEGELAKHALGATVQALVVDLHAEASSEKMALAHLADGRASAVIGTHTDVGMTGDYDSVIGMEKAVSLQRFRSHVPGARNTPALGEATLCAVYLEIDDRTGLARTIEPVRTGGRLAPAMPSVR